MAFEALPDVDTEPHHFVVPGALAPFGPLLRAMGVQERFGAENLVSILQEMATLFPDKPLPRVQLGLCVAVTVFVAKLHRSAEHKGKANAAVLALMLCPDSRDVLRRLDELSFDDAPWISNAMGASATQRFHFVHADISNADAAALGVQSLREQLFSGDEIYCPPAQQLSGIVGQLYGMVTSRLRFPLLFLPSFVSSLLLVPPS